MENDFESDLWSELIEKFGNSIKKSLEVIKERDIENIPGAKEQLIRRFEELNRYLPRNNGEILIKSIDESISNAFFPQTNKLDVAFEKILKTLEQQHENAFIINELINGFVASQSKSFGSFKEGPIIDRIIEAFKKSKNFRISDYSFYAMFGNPNKPRKSLQENLKTIAEFLGLVIEEKIIARDLARSEEKTINYYTFPPEILELLEGTYIIHTEKGETIINDDFDKNVFTSLFLARYSVGRKNLDTYKINGICAIFALILILSFMPKVKLSENNPVLRDRNYNSQTMSVIPKSWMMKEVLVELLPATIEIVAYRMGASLWYNKIIKSDTQKRLHLQTRFLIKDVNKWVLGNLCRVEIPIFVEISNIFQEITVDGSDTDFEN
ncbi:MAG: hypothetical protein ACTSQ5_01270 [Promethearchaeota archaeon]